MKNIIRTNLIIAFVLLIIGSIGCIKPLPNPYIIDDKYIDGFAKRGVSNGELLFLKRPNPSAHPCYLTIEQSRTIFKSLMPVCHISSGELPHKSVSYNFFFQGGRNPANFYISVEEDKLLFSFYGQIYSGGSSASFIKKVNEMKLRLAPIEYGD
jgi:hypothetical protein